MDRIVYVYGKKPKRRRENVPYSRMSPGEREARMRLEEQRSLDRELRTREQYHRQQGKRPSEASRLARREVKVNSYKDRARSLANGLASSNESFLGSSMGFGNSYERPRRSRRIRGYDFFGNPIY